MDYYSVIKKNVILPFAATWMGLKNIILGEVNQTKTNINTITCMWNLKIIQMNLYTKQKQTHRNRKEIYGQQRGEGMRDKLGVWD